CFSATPRAPGGSRNRSWRALHLSATQTAGCARERENHHHRAETAVGEVLCSLAGDGPSSFFSRHAAHTGRVTSTECWTRAFNHGHPR
ncbi:unnamed protein product, partial [Ectocarpus sp. 12 AP-2014]